MKRDLRLLAIADHLGIAPEIWHEAIKANLPAKLHEMNIAAFDAGRAWAAG